MYAMYLVGIAKVSHIQHFASFCIILPISCCWFVYRWQSLYRVPLFLLPIDYCKRRYTTLYITSRIKSIRIVRIEEQLEGHFERFVDCPSKPFYLDYCQRHYVVVWKSATDSFHDFAVSPIALEDHYDVTFAAHTS